MSKQNLFIKAGEIIYLSTGEFSGYSIIGHYVFVRDCDLKKLAHEYIAKNHCDLNTFIPQIVAQGYALPLNVREVYVSEYGLFNDYFEGKEND